MANEKGLMGKIIGMMTDDKGMFQGGKRNRMFGRVRDAMEGTPQEDYGLPPNIPPAAQPLTPMRDKETITSPEFRAYMRDRTPENLRALYTSVQPGGEQEYNKRLKELLDELKLFEPVEGDIQDIMNPGVPKRDYANPTDGNPFYKRGKKAQREPDPRIESPTDSGY